MLSTKTRYARLVLRTSLLWLMLVSVDVEGSDRRAVSSYFPSMQQPNRAQETGQGAGEEGRISIQLDRTQKEICLSTNKGQIPLDNDASQA